MVTVNSVLVVDDDPTARYALGRLLRRAGFEVFTAGDTDAAREYVRTCRPGVILADLELPNGDDSNLFVREVLAGEPDIKVVRITGKPKAVPADAVGDGVLTKPINVEDLLNRMKSYVTC